jgi:hypothetical protein
MSRTVVAALAVICAIASARAQDFSAEDLARRAIERRAVEAVIWGMPAVNFDLMLQAMIASAKGKPNQIVYWSRLPDWKNQTLTPNPDVIYLMPFFNTKDAGPMALEIPPADEGVINGTVMDVWQVPLEDVGPALPDYLKASQDGFSDPNAYPFDNRALVFTFAFFTPKHLGEGQFYLMTVKDKDGQNFDGSKSYRLTVPANAPVNQYWSATAYDRATHGLIRDMPRSGRGSQSQGLQKNADGSVDIYFGPKAPAGKDSNWVPTNPSGQFEVLFRFYGPEKPLFDKTWKLPDIERIAAP